INYHGGDGNDVVLTHVNSPALLPGRAVTPRIAAGGRAVLTGILADPDPRDLFVLTVNWGDGTPPKEYRFEPSESRDLHLEYRYRSAGHYAVALSWQDQHGAGNSATLSVTVVSHRR